ncbi:MAG TPA: sensor domain-containing diguanylate cyclase [Myxococcota bacterium]|nr:sensor domain-containing diguanylate cyclase [Myxococcota bacterium]
MKSKGERAQSEKDLIESLRRRNADLEVLYECVKDLSSTLSVERVLQRLLDRTLEHLSAEIGSILLLGDDDHLRVMIAQGLPPDVIDRTEMKVGEGISGYVALHGKPLLVEDVEVHPTFRRRNRERYYTSTLISAPLIRNGVLLGVININNKKNHAPFEPSDLRLLEAIAAHASVALGNARKYEDTLRLSQVDGLTGLANHGHFYKTLEREIERARRYDRGLSLVMLDIDFFKQYNDRNGHRAGDQALVAVARIIGDRSRAHDVVARYGGEEFAVILPETSVDGAHAFGEKLRTAMEGVSLDGEDPLTISVGVASFGLNITSASQLVEAADAQLYRAKSLGRNRTCSPGST